MRKIKAQKLSMEAFSTFGSYTSILQPEGSSLGDFYNDQVIFPVSGNMPLAFSPLILHKAKEMIVTSHEYHNTTGEGIVAMDDDFVLHVAPPTNKPVPDRIQAFVVPAGTAVYLKTGVWHNGGFPVHKEEAHVLIVLPERLYKTDCTVVAYEEQDQVKIEL